MRDEVNKKFTAFKGYVNIICNIATGAVMFLCELERRDFIVTDEAKEKIEHYLDSISNADGFSFIRKYREGKNK